MVEKKEIRKLINELNYEETTIAEIWRVWAEEVYEAITFDADEKKVKFYINEEE